MDWIYCRNDLVNYNFRHVPVSQLTNSWRTNVTHCSTTILPDPPQYFFLYLPFTISVLTRFQREKIMSFIKLLEILRDCCCCYCYYYYYCCCCGCCCFCYYYYFTYHLSYDLNDEENNDIECGKKEHLLK